MNPKPIWEATSEEINWLPIIISKNDFEEFYKKNKSIKIPSFVSEFDDEHFLIDMSRWSKKEKEYFIQSRKEIYDSQHQN